MFLLLVCLLKKKGFQLTVESLSVSEFMHLGSEALHQQNLSVINWRCRLTQIGLRNGCKTVVVVGLL